MSFSILSPFIRILHLVVLLTKLYILLHFYIHIYLPHVHNLSKENLTYDHLLCASREFSFILFFLKNIVNMLFVLVSILIVVVTKWKGH